ncbi:MAG: sensor histidine kinase [Myxococcota bacterium]
MSIRPNVVVDGVGEQVAQHLNHHDRTDGHVHLSAARSEDTIVFIVEDDGPGIPVHLHERAFGVFKTLRPRDEVEGSGIGLALVKRVVERHSGAITLESDEGEGARFIVTWPLPGS